MTVSLSTSPGFTPYSTFPPQRPASLYPAIRHSSVPARISVIPGRAPILSRVPPRPTLPPAIRAARMMGTVRKVASRLARRLPRHVDVDDLVGAGSLGLADAFSRRGTMPGSEFEAFAAYRIRGAMLDELRRMDAMPRRSRRSAKKVATAQRAIEQRLGRPAREDEVAAELQLDLPAYQALRGKLDAARAPVPLMTGGNGEDEETVRDVPDAAAEGADTLVSRAEIASKISAGVHALPERQRNVLLALHVEGKTLKQIGLTLGVTESRVCQIHTEALAALRTALGAEGEPKEKRAPSRRSRS